MADVKFIDNGTLPEYQSAYKGWYVMKDARLYVGTTEGWKELTNDEIVTEDISTASSTSTGLATAYDVKTYVESKLTSTDTYQFVLNDDGSLQCIKNSTDEGLVLNDDGSVELA